MKRNSVVAILAVAVVTTLFIVDWIWPRPRILIFSTVEVPQFLPSSWVTFIRSLNQVQTLAVSGLLGGAGGAFAHLMERRRMRSGKIAHVQRPESSRIHLSEAPRPER